jgi:predicted ester cyclase
MAMPSESGGGAVNECGRMALLTRFIDEVWNRGDINAADRYIAARYTVRHDPGDPWDGRDLDLDGYKERVRLARASCPDQRFELLAVVADDVAGTVVATWQWAGTHTGTLSGFAPTGCLLRMTGATVYSFDGDDRITGHWQVVDRLGVFQQLRRNAETSAAPQEP